MKPKRLLALGVLLAGVAAAASLFGAQKPVPPQPTEQQKLKERVDALDKQLKELKEKSTDAAKERAYVESIQKEAKDYYDKALEQVKWTVGLILAALGVLSGFATFKSVKWFDDRTKRAIDTATNQLEKTFDKKLEEERQNLEKSNAAQMKQLEDDLKLRSDWQFQFLQGMASVANKEYIDALHSFRKAVEHYKSAKHRDLLETRAGEITVANLFYIFSLTTENENDRDAHAQEELKNKLFDGLEGELAQASLRVRWLAPLLKERT